MQDILDAVKTELHRQSDITADLVSGTKNMTNVMLDGRWDLVKVVKIVRNMTIDEAIRNCNGSHTPLDELKKMKIE